MVYILSDLYHILGVVEVSTINFNGETVVEVGLR